MMLDISPNVKMIIPYMFRTLQVESYPKIYLHPQGIVEVDISDDFSVTTLSKNFDEYWEEFDEKGLIQSVGVNGLNDELGAGSFRFSTNAKYLAKYFNEIIEDITPYFYNYSHVSPYFRFMKYSKGGEHFPHYDSDYESKVDKTVTLYSLVMYLDDCEDGEIVFCNDSKEYPYPPHRNSKSALEADWDRQCTDEEIYLRFKPKKGRIILFPHKLCHAVLPFTGEQRRMIRGDLYFTRNTFGK